MSDVNIPGPHAEMTLDASGFQVGVSQAINSLDSLTNVVRNQWWGLQNLGAVFGSIGAAASAGLAQAVDAAVTWESAMADVERTTYDVGLSAEQNVAALGELEKGIRQIASITPISARGLAEIATQAGQLGVARSEIIPFTKTVADLAITTELTEEQAGGALARIAALTNISGEGFDRLASTILETGRSTAATEPQIVELARRIAGVGATVGLTADQIIGLSAATTSLGNRAEVSGTALQRAFNTMNSAVQSGEEELHSFGKVAGVTGAEFARIFREDAAEAFTLFIEGLSRLGSSGVEALKAVGLANERQITVMLTLAAAANNTANENVRLRNVLDLAGDSFENNSALAEITGRRYATLESRMQMVRDQFDEFITTVGEDILPVFAALFSVVDRFVRGLNLIPAPLRVAATVLVALTAATAGFLFVATTFVPRLVLMRMALEQLAAGASALNPSVVGAKAAIEQTAATGVPALQGLAASMGQVSAAANVMGASVAGNAMRSQTALAAVNAGQITMNQYLAATTGQAAATGIALKSTGSSAATMLKVIKGGTRFLGIFGTALAALTAITTVYGLVKKRDTDLSFENAEANEELAQAILDSVGGNAAAVNAWIEQQLAMAGVIPIAQQLGLTLAQLQEIIRGTANENLLRKFSSNVASAADKGNKSARKLFEVISNLRNEYSVAAKSVQHLAAAQDSAANSVDGFTDSLKEQEEAAKKAREELDKRNQAILALADAIFAQRSAQFAAEDAQERYNEALRDAQNPTLAIKKSENSLAQARLDQRKALLALRDAERNLNTARQRGREAAQDAQDALIDAQERYVDSIERIRDAEEKLDELRRGPTMEELHKATVRLERAQLKLVNAHQAVEDAEWQLNYLRREGAGNRDIREAELALADARLAVKESEIEAGESTEDLDKLRRGADPRDLAKAERDLEKAMRSSQRTLREIAKRERELADARRAVAEDRHYRDALMELEQAQIRLSEANIRLTEANKQLNETQSGDRWRAVARAQLELEQALYRLAKANVEVQKQTALSRGEFWDAGREAQALAAELNKLGVGMPEAIRRNLAEVSAGLRRATPLIAEEVADSLAEGLADGIAAVPFEDIMAPLINVPGELADEITSNTTMFDRIMRWMRENFATILGTVGAFVGRWGGAKIGAGIGGWFGPIGAVVGAVVGGALGALLGHVIESKWGDAIESGLRWCWNAFLVSLTWMKAEIGNFLESFVEPFKNMWNAIKNAFRRGGEEADESLYDGLNNMEGTSRLGMINISGNFEELRKRISEHMRNAGERIAESTRGWRSSFSNGVSGAVSAASELPGRIASSLSNLSTTLGNIAVRAMAAFGESLARGASSAISWVGGIASDIGKAFGRVADYLYTAGHNAVIGFWNGLVDKIGWLSRKVSNLIYDFIVRPVQNALQLRSPSKLFEYFGTMITAGLAGGLEEGAKAVGAASNQLTDAVLPDTLPTDLLDRLERAVRSYRDAGLGAHPAMAGGGGQATYNQGGDAFYLTAVTEASPEEIAEEFWWQKRIRSRS